MAKTYYNFAERSADSQINWAEVGKNVTDMLNTEAAIREEKKAAIDEASRQYGEVLANAPTGDFKAANEWVLDYANDAAQNRLIQDRLLKSGRLSVRDYTVQRQNLNDGTNQMFAISKEYQEKYKEVAARYEAGQSQEFEAWLMEQEEGLSNFTNTKAYINPTNGQVSIAKMKKVKGADGKEVMMMDDNPDNYMSVNQLRNRMNVRLDKYKYVEAIGAQVDGLGDFINTNIEKFKGGYRMIRIDEITDQKLRNDYEVWEGKMIQAELANPFNTLGLLTDAVDKVPGTNDFYTFTYDAELAKTDQKYILIEDDGSGLSKPKFTEEQTKVATEFLRTQTRQAVDQKIESDLQAEPAIQFDPYRQYENKTKVALGADEKKNVSYYEKANNAMRTGNVGALNTDDYSFHFEKGENGGKSVMYVATNSGKGRPISYTKDPAKFKPVTNANDLASYLAGINPKEAQQIYELGKKGFNDIHGFTLFGTYLGKDFTKTLDELYSPSTYTEEARDARRGSGGSTSTQKPSGGGASNSGGKARGEDEDEG